MTTTMTKTFTVIYYVGYQEYDSYSRPCGIRNVNEDEFFADKAEAEKALQAEVARERKHYDDEQARADVQYKRNADEWDALHTAGLREKSWAELHPDGRRVPEFKSEYSLEEAKVW